MKTLVITATIGMLLFGAEISHAAAAAPPPSDPVNLESYVGSYFSPETSDACGEIGEFEIIGDNTIALIATCVSSHDGIDMYFSCDPVHGTCVVDHKYPQKTCASNKLLLLKSGDILLENLCRGETFLWKRQR